jgi:hypothetical protein
LLLVSLGAILDIRYWILKGGKGVEGVKGEKKREVDYFFGGNLL